MAMGQLETRPEMTNLETLKKGQRRRRRDEQDRRQSKRQTGRWRVHHAWELLSPYSMMVEIAGYYVGYGSTTLGSHSPPYFVMVETAADSVGPPRLGATRLLTL
ncbi:cytochrome d ubiquinol oxidase subunit II [Sesbania bispinosa]|nr:cytochrome d ubiquinol oxidase subunit II [Sesbania bispinosa]